MYFCPRCESRVRITKNLTFIEYYCPKCNIRINKSNSSEDQIRKEFESKTIKSHTVEPNQKDKDGNKKSQNFDKTGLDEYIESENSWKTIDYKKIITEEPLEKIEISKIDFLDISIISGLKKQNISHLYKFQIESIKSIMSGESIVISAPTASGKTEAFLIPIIQKILSQPNQKKVQALIIYPTVALAADQISKINGFLESCSLDKKISAAKIDGSVLKETRIYLANNPPDILVTNFDTIQWNLPYNNESAILFKQAKIIVIDEAHSYCSFFGANISWILKRLKNFLSEPQFIASSATLDNPKEFAQDIFEKNLKLIEGKGRKKILHRYTMYPTNISQLTLMQNMSAALVKNGHKCLTFSNTQRDAEIIGRDLKNKKIKVRTHKGSFEHQLRNIIEQEMKQGDLECLSSTSTLELGIDIGSIDGVVTAFTNNLDNFLQRIGRAGRIGQEAYAFLILNPKDPVSNYYSQHIKKYFEQKHYCRIYKENPIVIENQEFFMKMDRSGFSRETYQKLKKYSIRDIGESVEIFDIKNRNQKMATRSLPIAYFELFKNSIYLHDGKNFRSNGIFREGDKFKATVEKINDVNYITIPTVKTFDEVLNTYFFRSIDVLKITYQQIHVKKTIDEYSKREIGKETDSERICLSIEDKLSWSNKCLSVGIDFQSHVESIHTLAHVLFNACLIVAKCDSNEIDMIIKENTIHFYDNSAMGGNGFSKILYEKMEDVFFVANGLIHDCQCHIDEKTGMMKGDDWGGCVNCTYITGYCNQNNENLNKINAKSQLFEFVKRINLEFEKNKNKLDRKQDK